MRAVLDTNVLVSALLFRGVASALVEHWKSGRLRLLVTEETLRELARVLAYPKFRRSPVEIEAILAAEVLPFSERIAPTREPPACRDPDDDEFLWCARDGKADALATGDPDLLALAPAWEGVGIVTVSELLARLQGLAGDGAV